MLLSWTRLCLSATASPPPTFTRACRGMMRETPLLPGKRILLPPMGGGDL